MTSHQGWTAGLVMLLFMATTAKAQIPAIPGAAGGGLGAATTGASAVGAAPAAGAAPQTLWGFLGLSKGNLAACKLKLCRSPIGKSLGGFATGPLGAVTGGLFANCCPPPTPGEIAALEAAGGPQGAEAVAAKIQADEADAKARVAAVDYLGTVDCRYWKEAQIALLNALRADRNECVRYAAARAFNNGCCCSKEVIETLRIVVAGEDSDGFPAEPSARVKGTCFAALQNCLMKVPPTAISSDKPLEPERGPAAVPSPPEPGLTPEGAATSATDPGDRSHLAASHLEAIPSPSQASALALTGAGKPGSELSVFETRVRYKSFASTVADARKTLVEVSQSGPATGVVSVLPAGKQSVFHALMKARQDLAANEAARNAAITSQVSPELIPPQPAIPMPTLQPTPTQAGDTKTRTFSAPDAPVIPVNLPIESAPKRSVPQFVPAPRQSAVKMSLVLPKLPSLSLPAAEAPKPALVGASKPRQSVVAATSKPAVNVKPRLSARIADIKRDNKLLGVSANVKAAPFVTKIAKPTEVNPSMSSDNFPISYGMGSNRTGGLIPAPATPEIPARSTPVGYLGLKPPVTFLAKPKPLTGSVKGSIQPPAASSPLPTAAKATEKPAASIWGFRAKPIPESAKNVPNRSEGQSVLQALMKARRSSTASAKTATATADGTSSKKAPFVALSQPAAKAKREPTSSAALKTTSKTDASAVPASYWGTPKPKAGDDDDNDNGDGDDGQSSPLAKRMFSKLFPDRSE